MEMQTYTLPGGYLDANGKIQKEVMLFPLSGREEELLTGNQSPSAQLVSELITRCVARIGEIQPVPLDVARALLVADREFILLMLRRVTFGDRVESTLLCPWPNCRKNIDVDFDISSIPITRLDDIVSVYEAEIASHRVMFRLPNGADQEIIASLPQTSEADVTTLLLQRCIVQIDGIPSPKLEDIQSLHADIRLGIETSMEERAPNIDLTMEVDCPECKRSFIAPFELQDFFFGEVKTNIKLLYREVHYLAFHYHWSESEIMSMPRERRRRYIDVLADEIEAINDTVR
ncbi:hypothetical protein SAMN05216326_1329 [Nitrosomonas marina]|uniref:DUF6760 domain-containing protein n=1 Tax=Nitrosomonas marina TaxID=917 RepID=A0A1I0F0Y0_9PROT|nr:DUF6760 family protein [Nitrosomonas marina]SET51496.1 hypothetical protein SAMN05216326_1329 [Nitrosomonas marina]